MISSIFSFALGGDTEEADLAEGEDLRLRLPHVRPVLGDEVLELALELGDPVLVGLALLLCGLLGPEDLLVHLALNVLDGELRFCNLTEGVVRVLPGLDPGGFDHSFSCHV